MIRFNATTSRFSREKFRKNHTRRTESLAALGGRGKTCVRRARNVRRRFCLSPLVVPVRSPSSSVGQKKHCSRSVPVADKYEIRRRRTDSRIAVVAEIIRSTLIRTRAQHPSVISTLYVTRPIRLHSSPACRQNEGNSASSSRPVRKSDRSQSNNDFIKKKKMYNLFPRLNVGGLLYAMSNVYYNPWVYSDAFRGHPSIWTFSSRIRHGTVFTIYVDATVALLNVQAPLLKRPFLRSSSRPRPLHVCFVDKNSPPGGESKQSDAVSPRFWRVFKTRCTLPWRIVTTHFVYATVYINKAGTTRFFHFFRFFFSF